MVASEILRKYHAVRKVFAKAVGAEKIVYSPTGVFLSCVEHIAPPGIGIRFIRIEIAEAIGKACGEKLGHLAALLIGKTCVTAVGLIVFEVDFLMGDVHIAADYNGFVPIERAEILSEAILPVHAVFKAAEVAPCVWSIYVNEIEIRIFKGYYPSFVVVALDVYTEIDRQRLMLCKDSRSGIAFLFRAVPILIIFRKLKIYLVGLELRFLKAEEIRIHLIEALHKSFFHAGAKAVYIPGYKFHKSILLFKSDTVSLFCTAGRR